ncbi:MAG TPA: dihydrofolate reductase family protein [Planctomycetota bacterium]|nr:dihydrofolate reductase family protein [Planctomycetota bacterium]
MHLAIACAISLDGKLSTAARDPVRFTSRRDRERLHALREAADAILLGARTIRAEDPPLLPSKEAVARRRARGKTPFPIRAVFSRTLDLPLGRALAPAEDAPVYVFTVETADEGKRSALTTQGAIVRHAPIDEALRILAAEQGVEHVLAEGGGELNAELFRLDLVDELELTVCPLVIGGATAPTLVDGPGFGKDAFKRARLLSHEATADGELFLRYSFR